MRSPGCGVRIRIRRKPPPGGVGEVTLVADNKRTTIRSGRGHGPTRRMSAQPRGQRKRHQPRQKE